jgi:hypothetical protein
VFGNALFLRHDLRKIIVSGLGNNEIKGVGTCQKIDEDVDHCDNELPRIHAAAVIYSLISRRIRDSTQICRNVRTGVTVGRAWRQDLESGVIEIRTVG